MPGGISIRHYIGSIKYSSCIICILFVNTAEPPTGNTICDVVQVVVVIRMLHSNWHAKNLGNLALPTCVGYLLPIRAHLGKFSTTSQNASLFHDADICNSVLPGDTKITPSTEFPAPFSKGVAITAFVVHFTPTRAHSRLTRTRAGIDCFHHVTCCNPPRLISEVLLS